jgi:hypothetical protein
MKTMRIATLTLIAVLLASGCMSGVIFTHTWQPLTVDMDRTRVVSTGGSGDIKHIAIYMASVAWDSAAIGNIAKKQGLHELYFADLETFSVLRIWNQYTVHVYGK